MNICSEFVLDDLTAITAIPVKKIPTASASSVALALTPTLSFDFPRSGYFDSDTVVIGQTRAVKIEAGLNGNGEVSAPVGRLVPIRRMTGKAKDAESDSVAGRLHTVTVSCEADDRDPDTWSSLLALERTPSHLLLTFRDGTQGFASATVDTYLCEVERDGAKTSVTFRIQNLMGIQLLR